jgi:hypothetical protein
MAVSVSEQAEEEVKVVLEEKKLPLPKSKL